MACAALPLPIQYMPVAGLPPENDLIHCPENGTSCYFMYPVARNYKDATARCAKHRGGYLVSWNTGGACMQAVMLCCQVHTV
jgi:hypothetical protein